ncbi:MAG: hypothetical protein ACK4GJ_00740 [bacterium]
MILLENIFHYKTLKKIKRIIEVIENLENIENLGNFEWGFVGGIPRDFFFYKKKLKTLEIDIVFFNPITYLFLVLCDKFKDFIKEKYFHQRFSTGKIIFKDGLILDLITARKESYPFAASLPVVKPTQNIIEDILRRDLTINTLLFKRLKKHPDLMMEIIDKTGGYQDLINLKAKILHPNSFKDDPTRIYRILRYKVRFNLELEKYTFDTLLSSIKFVQALSINRIFNEIKKINIEEKFDKIYENFFFLSFDPINIKQILVEEFEDYQKLLRDLKILRKSIKSFEKFFKNQKNKIKKEYDKNKVIFSFLLAKGFINNPKYFNLLSKDTFKLSKLWEFVFSKENSPKIKPNPKIKSKDLKNIYAEQVAYYQEVEFIIPLIFLLYKTNSLNLKFTLKKLFKKTFIKPLKFSFSFLNSISLYYFGKELSIDLYNTITKKIKYLYFFEKIRTNNQLIRYVRNFLKKVYNRESL